MKLLKSLFQRPGKHGECWEVMGLVDKVGPLLDSATDDLFMRCGEKGI